jgi:cytochrome c-type biogenesis protein CcmH/NrfG
MTIIPFEGRESQLADAVAQAKTGDLDAAVVTLKAVLQSQPKHTIALGMLASIYLQIGMVDRAIERYTQLLELDPENPLARFQLGIAKQLRGSPEEALEAWRPMLSSENEFMANFHSALTLVQLGRYADALEPVSNAARHMPPSHPLYPQLVRLRAELAGRATQ